jgi:hypothetical protein
LFEGARRRGLRLMMMRARACDGGADCRIFSQPLRVRLVAVNKGVISEIKNQSFVLKI